MNGHPPSTYRPYIDDLGYSRPNNEDAAGEGVCEIL